MALINAGGEHRGLRPNQLSAVSIKLHLIPHLLMDKINRMVYNDTNRFISYCVRQKEAPWSAGIRSITIWISQKLLRGTCLRRNFGAVIVKNDTIISTGYVGAPRGRANCNELHYCTREKLQVPRGERYELCRSVHAEQNAIINASRSEMLGATLYLVGLENRTGGYVEAAAPCSLCKRMIINAGIERVIVRDTRDTYRTFEVDEEWVAHDDSIEGIKGY